MKDKVLEKELLRAGAQPGEMAGLAAVASQLRALDRPILAPKSRRWGRLLPLTATALTALIVGASLVAYAQTSLPGSWAYPVKQLSEKTAVAIDPSYRATLMMRRSQEVRQLVSRHADQGQVMATLADYRSAAAAYKSHNYAAFEYCKSNLEQAAGIAPPSERAAINQTLATLNV